MGDPVEVGLAMDRIHRPRMAWGMIALIAVLTAAGFGLQVMLQMKFEEQYFLPGGAGKQLICLALGLGVMTGVCYLDYTRISRRAREVTLFLWAVFYGGLALFGNMINGGVYWISVPGMPSFQVAMGTFLFVPLYAGILCSYRGQGYLLFILDNRGSENRGKAFEQATFRQLGQVEMKDQMKGVEYLKTLPYVDADKIGVHGWSFGGFMTISLMTNYPDVFKVGVAGGPVIDWHWYEVMYGERYMDTPQTNPEGYKKTSLLYQAKNLKGKLQIIQGLNDVTVVPQHCLTFLKACIATGTQPDFFVYPGEPHNMRGHQSTHLHERISNYFFDYLK